MSMHADASSLYVTLMHRASTHTHHIHTVHPTYTYVCTCVYTATSYTTPTHLPTYTDPACRQMGHESGGSIYYAHARVAQS